MTRCVACFLAIVLLPVVVFVLFGWVVFEEGQGFCESSLCLWVYYSYRNSLAGLACIIACTQAQDHCRFGSSWTLLLGGFDKIEHRNTSTSTSGAGQHLQTHEKPPSESFL